MRWHAEHQSKEEEMNHPSDAAEWRYFQEPHPWFAKEPHNVYLGLCTDEFNPFGMSRNHSLWPVILTPYNLPLRDSRGNQYRVGSLKETLGKRKRSGQSSSSSFLALQEQLKESQRKIEQQVTYNERRDSEDAAREAQQSRAAAEQNDKLEHLSFVENATHPIQGYCSLANLPIDHQVFLSKIDQIAIPPIYEEAKCSEVWIEAVNEEHGAIKKNDTWDVVYLPKGKKIVGSKWVVTIKYLSNGEMERNKAHLVANGFTQTYGEEYKDTFVLVAKLHTFRVVLSLATNLSWDLWLMNVKNAFFQGELVKEVYVRPPSGIEIEEGKDIKLKKTIYGLKQSQRAWYHKLSKTIISNGFKRSEADHSLFTIQGKSCIIVVLVYVDDIIISGNDNEDEGLFLSQSKYTLDLLSDTGRLGAKPAKTLIEEKSKTLVKGNLRGNLMTTLDNTKELWGTSGKGIWMQRNGHTEIVGYCDAYWARDKTDRKSTGGYCTFVGGNVVAIHIASNSVFHESTKHIEVDCHHISEKVELGILSPAYTKNSDQLADIFTKATNSKVCSFIQDKLGLVDLHRPRM
ncbi:Transposon En/Spm-like [Arabidopsis thaliana x Arabidopsis arenosa]|uniref:Transposon En/Spm-like n=1 Tax=Arabidopsis thaliana x Arabidopsis arenosa TaxID=1240361 RepID=A0A8T1Y8E7_9BRAS|nr:Transposon En/Spm-like [Arabidopsis thaliana x Arabidopsis arenosa]